MAEGRATLLQEVHDGPDPPPATRAALGEGIAARMIFLQFLSLNTALLPFRQCSRAARHLASESTVWFRDTLTKPSDIPFFLRLFPNREGFAVLDHRWAREHVQQLAQCASLRLMVLESNVLSADDILLPLSNRCTSILFEKRVNLTQQSFQRLASLQRLGLDDTPARRYMDVRAQQSRIPWAFSSLHSLRSLSLSFLRAEEVEEGHLAPVAGQLHRLSVFECGGIRSFSAFTALQELRYRYSRVNLNWPAAGLDTLPSSLRLLHVSYGNLPPSWPRLAELHHLQELQLEDVGTVDEQVMKYLPPSVTRLAVESTAMSWPALAYLGHVRELSFVYVEGLEPGEDRERARAQAAALAGLTSLTLDEVRVDATLFPSFPTLTRLAVHHRLQPLDWIPHLCPALVHLDTACTLVEGAMQGSVALACVATHPSMREVSLRTAGAEESAQVVLTLFLTLTTRYGMNSGLRVWCNCPRSIGPGHVDDEANTSPSIGWLRVHASNVSTLLHEHSVHMRWETCLAAAMAAPRIALLHELHGDPDPPPAGRAAFGEGSAARKVLLGFLSLRSGLLPLRGVSRAARDLVRECNFTTSNGENLVMDFKSAGSAKLFQSAFPRASIRPILYGLSSQDVDQLRALDNLYVWSPPVDFPLRSVCEAVRGRCTSISLCSASTCALTDEDVDTLAPSLQRLSLEGPWETEELSHFPGAALAKLRCLIDLRLERLPADQLSDCHLLPLADRLQHLDVEACPGITDCRSFTRLQTLTFSGCETASGDSSLPPFLPRQLRVLEVRNCTLTQSWGEQLQHIDGVGEVGFVRNAGLTESMIELLPSSVHTLVLVAPELRWRWFRHMGHIRLLEVEKWNAGCVPQGVGEEEEARGHAAALQGLESLSINGKASLHLLPVMPHLTDLTLWGPFQLPVTPGWVAAHAPQLKDLGLLGCTGDWSFIVELITLLPSLRYMLIDGPQSLSVLLACVQAIGAVHGRYRVRVFWHEPFKESGPLSRQDIDDPDDAHEGWMLLDSSRLAHLSTLLPSAPTASSPVPSSEGQHNVNIHLRWNVSARDAEADAAPM